ncbi:glycoside hydrolase family 65 [Gracilibacillus sp. YIM 98692]|uniref:glycoside hydrolase family 65 n=1 Tax=Gracilibacillus sp. YIM 98692 TaxID=2663532 RepID=UPI0013D782C7|nr:glycoside hydrolase family 65 [Gracilibacillus sp. YIM 98692]
MNRKPIVDKHSPVITELEPRAPLSIGNGDFGFSVDFTGLQTFPDAYVAPLSTQSNWGWHASGGIDRYTLEDVSMQIFNGVPYPLFPEDREETYHWLRQNPHRLQLGQLGFQFYDKNNQAISFEKIRPIRQQLLLWSGVIESEFDVDGAPVIVSTVCASDADVLAVSVKSPLIEEGRMEIELAFPSPHVADRKWEQATKLSWEDEGHLTEIKDQSDDSILIERTLDDTTYQVGLVWSNGTVEKKDTHVVKVKPEKDDAGSFALTAAFAPKVEKVQSTQSVFDSSEAYWRDFWQRGAFVSFEGSSDPCAEELERRVILSQYLTAVHSAGSIPPQETGFMYNSWFGKFHLEMHWWHAAHFPLWGRAHLLERSMDWYVSILPKAIKLAESQGYQGARWPKMVAREGNQTPSPIAPGLIWQQPHPIALAELCYQASPNEQTLKKYKDIVFESAEFMVSYAHFDENEKAYVLGPPLIPAQECHLMEDSVNPPYEVEYWHYGLQVAIDWMERLGEDVPKSWVEVRDQMVEPPHENGIYLSHADCSDTFTEKNHDHPSMVAALGILPGHLIDSEMMLQTLKKVKDKWKWDTAWGWDFPMCAMTAARLGESDLAIDFLLMDQVKNTYLVNGHNYQHDALTAYLPGNGGLLTTVAMMASKWGFPDNGKWKVEAEGF